LKLPLILPITAEDRYLTINEAAEIIGVHAGTLRRWEKKDAFIPHERTSGNHRRYRYSDVIHFKRKRNNRTKKNKVQDFPFETKEDFVVFDQNTCLLLFTFLLLRKIYSF
jgi:excisionase family DNA binding protein